MGNRSVVAAAMSAALLTFGTVGAPEAGAEALLDPTFIVTPDSAEALDEVQVSGSCIVDGYTEDPPLVLQGEGEDVVVDELSLDADGTFEQTVTIPDVPASGSSYDLSLPYVYDPNTQTTLLDCGSDPDFYVVSLDLDRGAGEPGEPVNATGVCPDGDGSVTISFEDNSVGSATVDSSTGEFSTAFPVPELDPGSYEVTTSCNGHASFEVLAPVLPSLQLDPVSGEGGRDVTASGTCPRYTEYVEVFFEDTLVTSDSVDSSTGAFGPVTFSVPAVDPGSYGVGTDCGGEASFEVLPPVLPTLELDPVSGMPGSDVAARGMCPRYTEYVEIFFEDGLVTSASVDYWTGAFGPVGFPVPDVSPGSYDVNTGCGGEASFEVLDVLPTLGLDPVSGQPGDGMTATGTCPRYGESSSGSVEIFLGDTPMGSATVDASTGAFGPVGLPVPDVPPGSYVATTDCGGEASFEVLDVPPTLGLDPVSGQPGDGVTAIGTCPRYGESSSGSVEIFFDGESVDSATVDSSTGEFGVTFTVPDAAPGSYEVTTSCEGFASFEVVSAPVAATLVLSPASGHVGDGMAARGTCPVPSGSVEIFFEDTFVGYVTVDSSTGEFGPVGFPVPDVPPGSHVVSTDCGATASFEVLDVPPTLELDPASGHVGDGVSASGTCPVSSASVEIFFDATRVGSAPVDSSTGEFGSVDVAVPDVPLGSYGVTTTCGGEASFVVLPDDVIPATLELDPAQGKLGVDVTASGTCALDHPDVALFVDGRTVATTGGDRKTGEFEVVFPMLGVEGPTHTVTTSCGASEEFTLLLPPPSTTSPGPSTRAEPRSGGAPGPQARPNRPRSQLPTPRPIDTPQGIRILVPDLTGLTEDEVITALGDQLTLADRTGELGVVVRQLPLAGTLVEPASAVSILLDEPEPAAPVSETSRFPLAVLTVLVGALISALLYGERARRRHARERRWVDTDVRTELETAEPALTDVPDGSVPGLDLRLEFRRDPRHLRFREVGGAHD